MNTEFPSFLVVGRPTYNKITAHKISSNCLVYVRNAMNVLLILWFSFDVIRPVSGLYVELLLYQEIL